MRESASGPKTLYKYVDASRIDVFHDGLIRFSPMSAFNDPFEMAPAVSTLATEDEIGEVITDEYFDELLEELYAENKALHSLGLPAFKELAATQQSRIMEFIASVSDIAGPSIMEGMRSAIEEKIGVLSLTEIPNNLLMWAHYADSHRGFVIGFDGSDQFFWRKRSAVDEMYHVRRVVYSKERPGGSLKSVADGVKLFLTKSKQWSYEREWRMLGPLDDADRTKETDNGTVHLFAIPAKAITSVILGCRCQTEVCDDVRGLIASRVDLSHIDVSQASLDPKRFRLNLP